ncbi:MAG TPA: ATP-binding protein [Burkholderiaceae bacterium]|nr:ATP-binding protein [Burkholderiaceae bacterium]
MNAPPPLPGAGERLARRSRRLLLGLTLPLFVVVSILALVQYRDQRAQVREDLAAATGTYAISLNTIAKLATDHVLQMKAWSEGYLTSPPSAASNLREYFTPRLTGGQPDGYSLDALPADKRRNAGQLLWLTGDPRRAETGRVLLDQALDFFGLVRLAHSVTPYFQWSYFFPATRDYFTLYPWNSSRDLIEGQGHLSMNSGVRTWFDYEIFTAGTPANNPSRGLYWTSPYLDAAGAGAMVSLGAPVYVQERFVGIVGTDVTLAKLETFITQFPREVGRLWVLDAKDRVLADTAGSPANTMRTFNDVRPADVTDAALAAARAAPGSTVQTDRHTLVARTVPNAPWTLVYLVSDEEIGNLLLPRFVPYGVILAILALTFFIAVFVLRRELVRPALALARYIHRAAEQRDTPRPHLHALWQPVADVVSTALEANRRATQQLQKTEAFKSAILENAPLAIITTDDKLRVVEMNPAAQVLFQRSSAECLGRDFPELFIPERLHGWARHVFAKHLANPSPPKPVHRPGLRPDGSEMPLEILASVTVVEGQSFLTILMNDLSERTQAEGELARQRETLRQSEKLSAMGALLAGVAHELNNPLAILMGRAALLQTRVQDPALAAGVQQIHDAAERCGRIVRTFLSMARQRPAQRRPAQLRDVVAGAVDLVGYNLRTSGIDVEQQFDAHLPELCIDADQIGQILVNLLVNAQQALSERPEPRRVSIAAERAASHVVLRVADNGPGVAPEVRDRIFDPFFTTKTEGTGTGVGLSVSRAIAREHGGDLVLASSRPGATFELTLPLSGAGSATAVVASSPARAVHSDGAALVIDDEPEVAELLCDILNSAGIRAVAVASGRAALAWLDAHECSFILSDVRMPDLDGPALWRALREKHPRLLPHLAFVTGDTLSASVAPFLRETGLPSLEKPFTPDEVLSLVARIESD